jgi:flagellin
MIGVYNDLSNIVTSRYMQLNRLAMNQSMHRLATGRRINSGADDPAGLIASQSMDATLAALDAESSANQRASNVSDTADAALGQASDLLNQAKSLAAANANDSGLSTEEKQANQMEIDSILASVNRIASTTSFNGQKLLDGTGAISASGQKLSIDSSGASDIGKAQIDGTNYSLSDVGSGKSLATTNSANGEKAGQVIDAAISQVATIRGQIGAFSKNTLQTRLSTIESSRENMISTVSMIRDANYAMEAAAESRAELLNASSLLVLGQSRRNQDHLLDLFA